MSEKALPAGGVPPIPLTPPAGVRFDYLQDLPRSRNTDPETSHLAAERVRTKLNDQHQLVLELVKRFPGHTSAELARRLAFDRQEPEDAWAHHRPMVARRLPELTDQFCHAMRQMGPNLVRKGEKRACTVCGNPSVTWWPV